MVLFFQIYHRMTFLEIVPCFTLMINQAVCHQCIELAKMIRLRYHILNIHIEKIVDYFKRRTINFIEIGLMNKGVDRLYSRQLYNLCYICTMHHHLTKLIKLYNETFGVILSLMFGVSFVSTVISLFYCSGGLQANQIDWIRIFLPCVTTWIYVVDTVYICNTCYTTIEEANKSGELIHQIDTNDPEIRDEIEMFSLQIINEQVEFNAAGFFPIDYTLVFSIIGGVTTYIIILIQLSATVV
uniref:GR2 n=1 Tax=Hycleus cichorii TaxID=1270216 RepID=A0A2U9NJE7_9CUCU|nr:GR2 [Hycleus cichorii]